MRVHRTNVAYVDVYTVQNMLIETITQKNVQFAKSERNLIISPREKYKKSPERVGGGRFFLKKKRLEKR